MPRIRINGTELYYQLDGTAASGGSPALVLLNGIFQRTEAWAPLMPYLQGFRVLRYDMRGQGQSAVPEGAYTPELHADDLQILLQALGIEGYHLVGLSNGGIVAQIHATRQPKGLQKLILLCTTPRVDPLIRAKLESWQWALDCGGTRGRLQTALPWIWGRAFLETHPEINTPAWLDEMVTMAPTVEAQQNLMAGLLNLGDLRPQLARIKAPTLVLCAEQDLLFPPCYSQEIAEAIPGAVHRVLPRLGHLAALENTALVLQEIEQFLEVRA